LYSIHTHKLANYKELAKELSPPHDKYEVRFPTEGGLLPTRVLCFVLFFFSQREAEELD
jgi:hypothetical protein